MDDEKIKRIVNSIDDLPPLPTTLNKVNELAQDPNSSISDLVEAISLDQAMVARILKICNSPFYGLNREITSISHAAAYLGFGTIQGIATGYGVSGMFEKGAQGYQLDQGELWRHSVACAITSRLIADEKSPELRDTAFTAGLLHDIGKLILSKYVSQDAATIRDLVKQEEISFNDAERRILGLDHTEIGTKVAVKWKLARSLQDAIRYHHEPQLCETDDKIPHMVHIADCILMMIGLGVGVDGLNYTFHQASLDICGLTQEGLDDLIARSLSEFSQAEMAFSG